MTVQSFTNEHITYETTETSCQCGDWVYRGSKTNRPCKHMLAVQMGKDAAFKALRNRYDYRLNGTIETRRCYYELSTCGY